MLAVANIDVTYGGAITALRGVSLEVPAQSIVALLGSNGAGKTTCLRAISGLLKTQMGEVTAGAITFEGHRIEKEKPERIVKLGLSQVMEGRRVLEHFTVYENLTLAAHLRGDKAGVKSDLELVYGYFPRLTTLRHRTAGYLSGGEQQMLVIGRALMARPKLMLLDEPSMGLSPLLVDEIFFIIRRINEETKTSILVVEQNAAVALSIAHYAYVMENGKVVLDGPGQKLAENEDIKEFYLGLGRLGKRKSYREVKHYRRRKRWVG